MYILKLSLFIIFTVALALICLPLLIILYPWRTVIGPWLVQFYAKICLVIFKVTIEHADKINVTDAKSKGIILVPNHVSYLDIFLLAALYRTVYVSKVEVMYYPIIGQVTWLIGIIFLKRNSPEDRHKLIRTIANWSRERIITVFPQGTTSMASDPLPFKCGIFKTVEINHGIILLPVTIHYKEDKDIAWTKEQILIDNVKSVCSQKRIHVKVKIHKHISIDDYRDRTISQVCGMAQERVFSELRKEY